MGEPRLRLALLAAASAIGLSGVALRALGVGDRAPEARAPGGAEAASCAELTPAARRGKRIYQRGATADGRTIEGAIAGGAAALSGRGAACAGCHGPSGQGTDEGGIAAPALAREQRVASGREQDAPTTAAALAAAIREGRGLAGRPLNPVMPRYRLTDADLSDLIDYLRCVGRDPDPGVTADSVTLGAALPLSGPAAPVGAAVRDVLAAAFAEVNAQGGIYRRRIALRVEDSGGPTGEGGATARLLDGGVLALVGSVWSGDPALSARLSEERAPLVGPVGAGVPAGGDDVVFQVQPGPDVLARVAIKHLAGARPGGEGKDGSETDGRPAALVVHSRDEAGEAWLAGARAEAARRELPAPAAVSFEPGRLPASAVVEAARRHKARGILFWGPGADLARCAAAVEPASLGGAIYAPLASAGEVAEALSQASDRVLFLYSGPLGDRARHAGEELRAFLRRSGAAPGVGRPRGGATAEPAARPAHLAAQASAYVAARIAVEALKRAGAHVTREGLIAALEGLRDFDAGPAPLVTFARNRRTGVLGASLVRLDPASGAAVRASAWIDVVP
ncbi:cytochrome C [Sorangium cellulosum]|uniref:Cytochrome C n=1 Tax=Sorangium cellulosum TaxID=56 RepID=A0A3Q8I2J2_SORCE|nr:ABC transporter substrate-binding protein [Sorangium cellulosum]AUX21449.1 cytochrome C [Sorangium cellulosum]AYM53062.1 cytochrome C [Sorangium cellulosum]